MKIAKSLMLSTFLYLRLKVLEKTKIVKEIRKMRRKWRRRRRMRRRVPRGGPRRREQCHVPEWRSVRSPWQPRGHLCSCEWRPTAGSAAAICVQIQLSEHNYHSYHKWSYKTWSRQSIDRTSPLRSLTFMFRIWKWSRSRPIITPTFWALFIYK